MHKCIEHYTRCRKHTTIIAAELGPGIGTEHLNVGPYTLNESNKRGDRLKHGPMIPNFVALNTMFKKRARTSELHFVQRVGKDKQLD